VKRIRVFEPLPWWKRGVNALRRKPIPCCPICKLPREPHWRYLRYCKIGAAGRCDWWPHPDDGPF